MSTRRLLALSPVNIALVYLVFGVLWIVITDAAVVVFVADPDVAAFLQMIKGWLFVALSAGLIFGLARVRERQIERSEQRLRTATEQIQVLHRVLRHNIRNDVNVIHGYVTTVQDELESPTSRAQLDHALDRTRRIARMSDKIRILGDIDITAGTDEVVDLVRITEHCLEDAKLGDDNGVTVTTNFPDRAPVRATEAVNHAVTELLENAVEHAAGTDGTVSISIDIRRNGGNVRLEMSDDGPGIPSHELAPLRAESESELRHMSGVGLWITKWLCDLHDGTIDVEATADGTTATLSFREPTPAARGERAIEKAKRAIDEAVSVST